MNTENSKSNTLNSLTFGVISEFVGGRYIQDLKSMLKVNVVTQCSIHFMGQGIPEIP